MAYHLAAGRTALSVPLGRGRLDSVLLGQSLVSGALAGGLYTIIGLGLTLSWRFLRVINLSQFALAILGAYLFYQFCGRQSVSPVLVLLVLCPLFACAAVAQQAVIARFRLGEFATVMLTFGVVVVTEVAIQAIWSADPVRLEAGLAFASVQAGPIFIPIIQGLTLLLAVVLAVGLQAALLRTRAGRALRASVDNPAMAAAFGIRTARFSGAIAALSGVLAAVAGGCLALASSLSPGDVYAFISVVFAAVLVGGLGRPLGLLGAGLVIGELEAATTALATPTLAPLVSFATLLLVLVLWPERT